MTFTLGFEDGDGDIGFLDEELDTTDCVVCFAPGEFDCIQHPTWDMFFIDERDSCLQQFHLPRVEPQTRNGSVRGNIIVRISDCCKTNVPFPCQRAEGVYDTTTYQILIKDREGRLSNIIKSPPFIIKCF